MCVVTYSLLMHINIFPVLCCCCVSSNISLFTGTIDFNEFLQMMTAKMVMKSVRNVLTFSFRFYKEGLHLYYRNATNVCLIFNYAIYAGRSQVV